MEEENKGIKICEALEGFYPYVDGVVKAMDNYAKELSKTNECCVAASNIRPKKFDYGTLPYRVLKCPAIFPSGYRGMRLPVPALSFGFKKRIKKEKFDIYHIHSPFVMARCMQKIAKKQKRPVVVSFHTKYKEDFDRTIKIGFIKKMLMRYLLKTFERADSVWAPNNASVKILRGYGYKGDVLVMPNAIDMSYPENPEEARREILGKYAVAEDEKVFLFVGRLFLYKNLYFICDSLKILKDKGLRFKMFFVGGGDDTKKLKDYIAEQGLADNIILTGTISDKDELAKYYLASDVFLFPSTFDTAGISVLEAAFFKVPSVLIKGSASADGKTDGVNAALSEENPEEFSRKIFEFCADEGKRKETGENAARDIAVTWEQISGKISDSYIEIIAKYKAKTHKKT